MMGQFHSPVVTAARLAVAALCLCGAVIEEEAVAGSLVIKSKRSRVESEGLDIECTGKKSKRFSGTVFSFSLSARSITVKQGETEKAFRIASNCALSTADKTDATLTDIKLGQEVQVSYFTNKFDTDIACSIGPPKKKKTK